MKVEYNITVDFTHEEACSLKRLLGHFTDVTKRELGLNPSMIERMRELYDKLPYGDYE